MSSFPSMRRRILRVERNTLIGIGLLALAPTMAPTPACGENPAGESTRVTQSHRALAGARRAAPLQPVSNEPISLKIAPHTSGPLTTRSARNLFMGFSVALDMVREKPSCNALFEPFATSGVEEMKTSFYVAPTVGERRELCIGGVTAFTQVGSRVTRLCPSFGDLDREAAALLLIHEALHSAGMPESPSTAGALTPSEISRLVKNACGL